MQVYGIEDYQAAYPVGGVVQYPSGFGLYVYEGFAPSVLPRDGTIWFFGPEEAARLEFRTINGVCSRIIRLYEQEYGRTAFSLLEENRKSALLAELFRAQSREFATESTVKGLACLPTGNWISWR